MTTSVVKLVLARDEEDDAASCRLASLLTISDALHFSSSQQCSRLAEISPVYSLASLRNPPPPQSRSQHYRPGQIGACPTPTLISGNALSTLLLDTRLGGPFPPFHSPAARCAALHCAALRLVSCRVGIHQRLWVWSRSCTYSKLIAPLRESKIACKILGSIDQPRLPADRHRVASCRTFDGCIIPREKKRRK